MSPRDKDDVLHPVNPQFKFSGPSKPAVDMLDYALAKFDSRYGVFSLSPYWKT